MHVWLLYIYTYKIITSNMKIQTRKYSEIENHLLMDSETNKIHQ